VDLHLQVAVVPCVVHGLDMQEAKPVVAVDEGLTHGRCLGMELRLVVACKQVTIKADTISSNALGAKRCTVPRRKEYQVGIARGGGVNYDL